MRKYPPPPTKFSPTGAAQPKAVRTVVHAPPPTKFGPGSNTAPQAKTAGAKTHLPPPTKYPASAQAAAQAKPVAGAGRGWLSRPLAPRPILGFSAIQRMEAEAETETLEDRIIRILAARRIIISMEEAARYAAELTSNVENTLIPIVGRHRALKINRLGVISSVEWRPPSDASRMRVSAMNGPLDIGEGDMLTMGPRPITGMITQQDVTISKKDLANIPQRPSLFGVMGGSATVMSGIQNSEWLHLVAHSLGGPDTPINLVAGPHSLNTAMIPFEACVRGAVQDGSAIDYRVTFFSDVIGEVHYVHHVEISIIFPNGKKGTWTLEVNRKSMGDFINGGVLGEIEGAVASFKSQ